MRTIQLLMLLPLLACSGDKSEDDTGTTPGTTGTTSTTGTTDTTDTTDTTSTTGTPVELAGRAYRLDLSRGDFVKPAGLADLLLGNADGDPLVSIAAAGASSLELVHAWEQDDSEAQDECIPTERVEATWSAPAFESSPTDYWALLLGGVPLSSYRVAGSLDPMTGEMSDVSVDFVLDQREAGRMLESTFGTSDPDEVCEFFAGFGAPCEPCADGEPYCVPFLVENIEAEELDYAVVEITEPDPDCE